MSYQVFSSNKEISTNSIEIQISPEYSRCFAGIRYFDTNDNRVTPTSGTVKIQVKHLTNNTYADVYNATLDATEEGAEAEWGGNVTYVKATPNNLSGTDLEKYQLVVVQNLN